MTNNSKLHFYCIAEVAMLFVLTSAPLSKNTVSAFQISCKLTSFTWKIPEEISRRSILFNNLRQYLPYQTYVHTTTVVNWPEIWCLMEAPTMLYIYLQILHFYLVWKNYMCGYTFITTSKDYVNFCEHTNVRKHYLKWTQNVKHLILKFKNTHTHTKYNFEIAYLSKT